MPRSPLYLSPLRGDLDKRGRRQEPPEKVLSEMHTDAHGSAQNGTEALFEML